MPGGDSPRSWPGSESHIFLAIANYLIQKDSYDRAFVKTLVNLKEFLEAVKSKKLKLGAKISRVVQNAQE